MHQQHYQKHNLSAILAYHSQTNSNPYISLGQFVSLEFAGKCSVSKIWLSELYVASACATEAITCSTSVAVTSSPKISAAWWWPSASTTL